MARLYREEHLGKRKSSLVFGLNKLELRTWYASQEDPVAGRKQGLLEEPGSQQQL